MNYNNSKSLFNYILQYKYKIKKDVENNDIMYINYKIGEIKCKYLLLFNLDNNNIIHWSCDNPFIDQKTRIISLLIKNFVLNKIKIKNNIYTEKINKILYLVLKENSDINFEDEKINFLWIITGKIKEAKQFYIITEIIYM